MKDLFLPGSWLGLQLSATLSSLTSDLSRQVYSSSHLTLQPSEGSWLLCVLLNYCRSLVILLQLWWSLLSSFLLWKITRSLPCGPSMTHARSRVRIESVLCGSSDGCYAQSDLVVFPECLDLAVFSKMYQ